MLLKKALLQTISPHVSVYVDCEGYFRLSTAIKLPPPPLNETFWLILSAAITISLRKSPLFTTVHTMKKGFFVCVIWQDKFF